MVGMGSRGTEACDSSLRVVLVVWVPGFLCSVLAWLCFLCSVLAWLWCGRASAGSGFCDLVVAFVPINSCAVVADWRFVCPGLP